MERGDKILQNGEKGTGDSDAENLGSRHLLNVKVDPTAEKKLAKKFTVYSCGHMHNLSSLHMPEI